MKGQLRAGRMVIQKVLTVTLVFGSFSFDNFQKANGQKQAGIELITIGSVGDAPFLIHVAEIYMEEVLLGQLAQKKSRMPDIQEFGKMMEETHSQSFIQLKELAKKKNL